MITLDDEQVIRALQQSVIAAVATTTQPTIPIKFLNAAFEQPSDPDSAVFGRWIETVHIPNNPPDPTWGDEQIYRGIYRILLHWPNLGQGSYEAHAFMKPITAYYVKGRKLNGVLQLMNRPKLTSVIEQGKELILPFSFEYCSFSP